MLEKEQDRWEEIKRKINIQFEFSQFQFFFILKQFNV